MKAFIDTAYFIAILNPLDQLAESAVAAHQQLGDASLVTTEEVLTEFLNAICEAGPSVRARAYEMVLKVLSSPKIQNPDPRSSFPPGGFHRSPVTRALQRLRGRHPVAPDPLRQRLVRHVFHDGEIYSVWESMS